MTASEFGTLLEGRSLQNIDRTFWMIFILSTEPVSGVGLYSRRSYLVMIPIDLSGAVFLGTWNRLAPLGSQQGRAAGGNAPGKHMGFGLV